jgi:2-polyprenyl-3-methyl-5-hydroxy-6-metoxy-1,4-benzoquinol methylase
LVNTKNNSVGSNDHITRDAGNVFEIRVGGKRRFFRPAQYSDNGINGEGVTIYEIITLTTDNYREIPIDLKIQPLEWIRVIHTFSYNHEILVMDARKIRSTDHEFKNVDKISIIKNMLERNIYINHEILKEAFACNTSGNGRCYYEINIDNKVYEGERNWDERWNLIKDCIPFRGMEVLEIGSNMGILSTYLKTFRETSRTVCVDEPDEMLLESNKRDTIKAAKLLDKAFGIENQIDYIQIDLNKTEYEQILGENFDFVAALSIFKWIEDGDRFLYYLSRFKHVLYEGHDPDEVEIERFARFGFDHKILGKTQTGKSYAADNTRTLILFTKSYNTPQGLRG